MSIQRRGLLFVLSSPSGAGKTSISRAVLQGDSNLKISVSVTTRPPRLGEVDGVDYHFISHHRFQQMVQDDALLEHAKVFDNYYGTPRSVVEQALQQGQDILCDIDWQGGQQLFEKMPGDIVKVFVLPPSTQQLATRLRTRALDSEQVIQNRMAKSADEMSHFAEYDWVIINTDLPQAISDVKSILQSERLRRVRQVGLNAFVKNLRGVE